MNNINKLNEFELKHGFKGSWHDEFKNSAYIYIGGLPYDLNEGSKFINKGDIIQMFSQYGEVVDLDLKRDKETKSSLGYCFLGYEDQRSTILAVDNFNGVKVLDRTIKVDHTFYKPANDEEFNERRKLIFPFVN